MASESANTLIASRPGLLQKTISIPLSHPSICDLKEGALGLEVELDLLSLVGAVVKCQPDKEK